MTALPELLHALAQPAAYPYPVERVELRQTHISAVFLAGDFVYKVKKPVRLPFVDFSTLEQREQCCRKEVRLNRRLAPQVYLDVVPFVRTSTGLQFEGDGAPVEWAVKMARLPDAATLEQRLLRQELDAATIRKLARRVAAFHADAERHERMAPHAAFAAVARNARDNLHAAAGLVGTCLSRAVLERLHERQEASLAELQSLIDARARGGMPRDTHGDLHLDHIYFFPDRPPPNDLVIIDCIEFNDAFRYADPVADMAFAFMDLCFHGRHDLADAFADAYFAASGDAEGRKLLPFYSAYRAMVRGKVEGITLGEPEIAAADKGRAQEKSRAHWLLALTELAEPADKPCLLLIGGLPGSGKSTLTRHLADAANFHVLRSDVVRKELAGHDAAQVSASDFGEGLYSPEWDERTYAECLRRATALLWEGKRVIVDASFRAEANRHRLLEAAVQWGVPGWLLLCEAPLPVLQQRVTQRQGDASDADAAILAAAAARWEPLTSNTERSTLRLATTPPVEAVVAEALRQMQKIGVA